MSDRDLPDRLLHGHPAQGAGRTNDEDLHASHAESRSGGCRLPCSSGVVAGRLLPAQAADWGRRLPGPPGACGRTEPGRVPPGQVGCERPSSGARPGRGDRHQPRVRRATTAIQADRASMAITGRKRPREGGRVLLARVTATDPPADYGLPLPAVERQAAAARILSWCPCRWCPCRPDRVATAFAGPVASTVSKAHDIRCTGAPRKHHHAGQSLAGRCGV